MGLHFRHRLYRGRYIAHVQNYYSTETVKITVHKNLTKGPQSLTVYCNVFDALWEPDPKNHHLHVFFFPQNLCIF